MRLCLMLMLIGLFACAREPISLLEVEGVAAEHVETGSRLEITGGGFPTLQVGRARFVGKSVREGRTASVNVLHSVTATTSTTLELVADRAWVEAMRGRFEGTVEVSFESRLTHELVRGRSGNIRLLVARDELDPILETEPASTAPSKPFLLVAALVAATLWLRLLSFVTPLGLWLGLVNARISRARRHAARALSTDGIAGAAKMIALGVALALSQRPRLDGLVPAIAILVVGTLGEAVYADTRTALKKAPRALFAFVALLALMLLCASTTLAFTDAELALLSVWPALFLSPVHLLAAWVVMECTARSHDDNPWLRALVHGGTAGLLAPVFAAHFSSDSVGNLVGALAAWTCLEVLCLAPLRTGALAAMTAFVFSCALAWAHWGAESSMPMMLATMGFCCWLVSNLIVHAVSARRLAHRVLSQSIAPQNA